jgi:hypothetical protein
MKLLSLLMVAILGLSCSGCLTMLAIHEVKKIHDRQAMHKNDQNQDSTQNQNQNNSQDQDHNSGQDQNSNGSGDQNRDSNQ